MLSPQDRVTVLFFIGSMGGGGAERQVVEILKRIDRQCFRPVLFLHHREGPLLEELPADVPVYSLWSRWTWKFHAKWHLLRGDFDEVRAQKLARIIRREQVDLVYNQTYLATLDAARACEKTGTPRISVCVGDPLKEIQLYASGSWEEAFQRGKNAFLQADRVVAVSNGIRNRLIADLHCQPEQVEVQSNMLDLDSVAAQANEDLPWEIASAFEDERTHLLTVGRFSAEKGHRFLLEGLSKVVHESGCQDVVLHLVGTGPLEAELKAQVAQLNLNEFVRFEGYQKNPYPFYRLSDLLCLPSVHEAFGCVLTEALACQLPVLATDCQSGPREILSDGQYGRLVPPEDPAAIAAAILDFRSNRIDWREQASRGCDSVRQTFGVEKILPRVEQLMLEVLTASQTPGS